MRIGQLVAGRYAIEELLGVGGMSSVFRARDAVLERTVALKVLHEQYSDDPEYVERFRREARAIARLSHPNIVTVIDRGEFEGRRYIVFEYVRGENLKRLVERTGPLPVEEALALAHQVARGLAFAHEHGVVHRDVKPHNVLVDADGVAKVTDFGIARSLDADTGGLTTPGTLIGTSDYLAPEQAEGAGVDARSDQYSLGVLLFELLTGRVAYPGDNAVTVAMRHVHDPVPSVRALRPDVPPRVEALVRRAMAKRPEDRFPSTDALIAALEACLADELAGRAPENGATDVLRGRTPAPAHLHSPQRRRARRRLAAAAAVLLAAAALAGALAVAIGGDDGAADGRTGARAGGGGGEAAIRLRALRDFDPEGDGREHPEDVPKATDGDRATYWTTETYRSFQKRGVGIVLDAGRPVAPSRLVVVSDEPGFRARIRAGPSATGPFTDVSPERTVTARTVFPVDTGGEEYRYFLLWITDPNARAHVNDVRAR